MLNHRNLLLFAAILVFATFAATAQTAQSPILPAPPAPQFSETERQSELAARRKAVISAMKDKSILLLFSAEPRIYTGDVDYTFRQENNLYYLTALKKAGSVLVIAKSGDTIREAIFLPDRNPAQEMWTGKMYSQEDAQKLSGIKSIISASETSDLLNAIRKGSAFRSSDSSFEIPAGMENLYLLLPTQPSGENGGEYRREAAFAASVSSLKIENAAPIFAELRQIKSVYEIKLLQHAIDITTEAIMRSMATARKAKWEYEVQAETEFTFRRRNADFWGYPSIVGCGPNATILHYEEAQGPVRSGDLLLMDVGAEYDHYTADVTRTFPVSGKFTREQAEIYQIVFDAQEAVARTAKPGVRFDQLTAAAREVIADGLLRLGLITEKNPRQVSIWFPHGLGHWLGMNVHDVGRYGRPLAPGMVFTNEPGIYIRPDALDYLPDTPANRQFKEKVRPAVEKYKNIGVRIEDDLLVTENGVVWLTAKLPRSIKDIESFMASLPPQLIH
jgi:Xaa-Pro aminopeptidase